MNDNAAPDRFGAAHAVADAVLYEGYVLYPYRASSRKNQARFQWGVLTPRRFSEADGSERWSMRTECLIDPGAAPTVSVRVRCLHAQRRMTEKLVDATFARVEHLEVDGIMHVDWDEAVDRIVDIPLLEVLPLDESEHVVLFSFEAGTDYDPVRSVDGAVLGRFVRQREPITGRVRIGAGRPDADSSFLKVVVTVENITEWAGGGAHRDDAMAVSLISVHTMLMVDDGTFVSLLDPPDPAVTAARACHSEGAYPVLIGDDDVVLSSPIILYDHPEVAPQSPGDLYDSLEIDEILALRVMTLTDAEKAEARGTDARAAAIIDRCDDMAPETCRALHGQMKPVGITEDVPWWDPAVDASFDPWTETVWIAGVEITKGSAVRLRPSHRADAQDIFLAGLPATVAGVFTDVDGDQHVAVTVDDDPATEELTWQGRYLFFHVDEVEPLLDQSLDRMSRGVLVAGIGNIFQSDDAFGVEVVNHLARQTLPAGVRVEDFGIRGVHLAYELLEGYDGVVIVDAVPMGEAPGTLVVMVPERNTTATDVSAGVPVVDAHTMNPDVVLATLTRLGGSAEKIFVVGCQPASLQDGMGLTPSVAAAVAGAVQMCCQLISEMVEPVTKGAFP